MLATTIQHSNTTPHHQSEATTPTQQGHRCCLRTQPCVDGLPVAHPIPAHYRQEPLTACPHHRGGGLFVVLLRKEVIQPHLPVRLPCYDFVPIADPTFDSSLPKG